jgi:HEPN domain-containing protein
VRGQEPPWGHLLRQLADLAVASPEEIPAAVYQAVDRLQPIFGETRYPSGRTSEPIPAELVSESVAHEALESAEEVMAWVRTLLQGRPAKA